MGCFLDAMGAFLVRTLDVGDFTRGIGHVGVHIRYLDSFLLIRLCSFSSIFATNKITNDNLLVD